MAVIKKIITADDKQKSNDILMRAQKMNDSAIMLLRKPNKTQDDINQLVVLLARIMLKEGEQ